MLLLTNPLWSSLSAIINASPPNRRNDSGTPLRWSNMGNQDQFGVFFFYYQQTPTLETEVGQI
jgi:hypothetical protein